jgi:transposase
MYVRALNPEERAMLEAGLRSSDAFTLRRSQILLASSRGQRPKVIAANLGCVTQTVRNTIHAFEQKGVDCLKQESSRPKTVQAQFDQAKCEALRAILHKPPHVYGKKTSIWTLALAAEVCFEQGLTENLVSIETLRQALLRLGVGWQRAKHWITSPDPDYVKKKNDVTPSLRLLRGTAGKSAIWMKCGGAESASQQCTVGASKASHSAYRN